MNQQEGQMMLAWQLHDYETGPILSEIPIPRVEGVHDVLVKVRASSVNNLDIEMLSGYGHVFLQALRKLDGLMCRTTVPEFPLTLGRDFVGEVVAIGRYVKDINVGDVVVGVTNPHKQGAHAEYVLASDSVVTKKPDTLTDEEGASLLYAGLTAWSALKISGGLAVRSARTKTVLVLGGSGGVGSIAVQLLKAWGAQVITTCSTSAIPFVQDLKPDIIIDYSAPDFEDNLKQHGPYDLILDAAGISKNDFFNYTVHLKHFSFAGFITLRPPVLPNTDRYGLLLGNIKNIFDLFAVNVASSPVWTTSTIRWGIFVPFHFAIEELVELAAEKKVLPRVTEVYSFAETPRAYERAKKGHLRGKIVISFSDLATLKAQRG